MNPTHDSNQNQGGLPNREDKKKLQLPASLRHSVKFDTINFRDEFQRNPSTAALLLKDYYPKYVDAFPDPNERFTIERLVERLVEPNGAYTILGLYRGSDPIGGRHFQVLNTGNEIFGFGEHIWVDPQERGNGIGPKIVEQTEIVMRAGGATFAVSEFNDPNLMNEAERQCDMRSGITPEARLRFWERLGYIQVNAPYVMPPLNDSSGTVEYLMIGVKPLVEDFDRSGMTSGAFSRVMKCYFGSYVDDLNTNPYVIKFEELLKNPKFLNFIPLSEMRTFCQDR